MEVLKIWKIKVVNRSQRQGLSYVGLIKSIYAAKINTLKWNQNIYKLFVNPEPVKTANDTAVSLYLL